MPEPLLELIGIARPIPACRRSAASSLAVAPRRGPRPDRRERRRQIDPDEDPGRRRRAERRHDPHRRQRSARSRVADAIAAGIAFVHQELNLFDNLDVAANVFIGREPVGGPLRLDRPARAERQVTPLLERLGADFDPDTPVADLSLAQRQLVEIAKALSLEAASSSWTSPPRASPSETARLLEVIAELKAGGVSVDLHLAPPGRGRALRRPRRRAARRRASSASSRRAEIEHDAMIRLMIGRDLKSLYIPPAAAAGRRGARAVEAAAPTPIPASAVDLALRRGEILGMAGLVGVRPHRACPRHFRHRPAARRHDPARRRADRDHSPRDAIDRGIFLVPEDRKRSGLLLDFSITENISLPEPAALRRGLSVQRGARAPNAERQRRRLNIRTPRSTRVVGTLSGGNQQKVVLAKWLSMPPKVVIFDEPTRGIDVGAKSEIYELMRGLADAGVAVLMISSDMEEVIGVSDRIAVMHEGRISGFLERAEFSEDNVLQLAVGQGRREAELPC